MSILDKYLDKYDNIIVSHGDYIGSDTDFHNLCMNYRKEHPNKYIRMEIFYINQPNIKSI